MMQPYQNYVTLDEKLAENRFLQLLKYKNGQQLYDKKNKNTKA